MEEGMNTCSQEGCDAPAACEKCNGCEGHCKCGSENSEDSE